MVLMCLCKNQKMREIPLLVLSSNSGLNKLTFQGQEACTQAIGTAQWTMSKWLRWVDKVFDKAED